MSNTHTSTKASKKIVSGLQRHCGQCLTISTWLFINSQQYFASLISVTLLRWLRLQYTHARSNNQEIHEHEHLTIKTKIQTSTTPFYRVQQKLQSYIQYEVKYSIRNFVNKTFIVGCYLYWCKVDNTMSWVIAELITLLHCCVKINIFQFLV